MLYMSRQLSCLQLGTLYETWVPAGCHHHPGKKWQSLMTRQCGSWTGTAPATAKVCIHAQRQHAQMPKKRHLCSISDHYLGLILLITYLFA